jgi:lipopolysaccharide transport system ATP-binding protein
MNDYRLRVRQVRKKFCRNLGRSMMYGMMDIARDALGLRTRGDNLRPMEFWAVDDVSFDLRPGEVLGIIGANGAGKSTLLKMISGIIPPDGGRIEVRGRLSALIEIGAGFHPLLTGRENIYVNGAILGMSRREVDQKFEAIVEFSGLREFLDTPVKFYSSGMYVRLGFAIAAHLDPDILIVDEVLAVGDAAFQRKCIEHLNGLRENGVPFIVVSHNMQTISALATQCLMLESGKVVAVGSPTEVVPEYDLRMRPIQAVGVTPSRDASTGLQLVRSYSGYSLDDMVIESVWLEDASGQRRTQFLSGEEAVVCIRYHTESGADPQESIAQVSFMNEFDLRCLGSEVRFFADSPLGCLKTSGIIRIQFESLMLSTSTYRISTVFQDLSYTVPHAAGIWGFIEVRAPYPAWSPTLNMPVCWAPAKWTVSPEEK